jgi:transposase
LVVETVVRIRREHAGGKPIKAIARDLRLSRKVVRKAIRGPEGAFDYHRAVQPLPRIGPYQERLDALLLENEARARRDRLRMTRIHDLLKREGFEGSYDAVRRYATRWADARRKDPGGDVPAFIPLMFRPGEAYQFDWSHEDVEIAGKPMRIKVAHVRLCASRAMYVRAYPRETQEMLFDAHACAFAFFGGVPLRGIYDNMKTAVTTVFTGKERIFNRRFLIMADHYMVEPTACSPAAGWEKGQVENQVQTIRGRFFQPRLRFASLEELNGWLEAECRRWAAMHPHPEQKEMTVAEALEVERPALQPMLAPFDGFHETQHAVTGTCLIKLRPQPLLRGGQGRALRRPGPRLCRPDRRPPGRRGRCRASPLLRAGSDDPRPVALPACARQEARCSAQRDPVPGVGSAACAQPAAPQARQRRRSRSSLRARAGSGADRWPGGRGRRDP